MKTLQELHQQRQTALDDAVKLSAEDADWSDETSTKFDGLMAEASALEKRIDQARELERAKAVETVVPILKPGANTPLNQADGVPAPTKLFPIPANAKRYGRNRLTAFTGPDGDVSAYLFAMLLLATLLTHPHAHQTPADHGT